MRLNKKNKEQLDNLTLAAQSFSAKMIIWLGILFALSIAEIIFNGVTHEFPQNLFTLTAWAWLGDLLFWLQNFWWWCILYLCISLWNRKVAHTVLTILIIVFAVLQLLLIIYFNTSLVLLGGDFFDYSFKDIKETVGASGSLSFGLILGFIVVLAAIVFIFNYLHKKVSPSTNVTIALAMISILSVIFGLSTLISSPNLKSDFANNLVVNKSAYFISASYMHFFPKGEEVDIYADNYIGDYGSDLVKPITFNFIDENSYPFLHHDETPDVLSPFFNLGKSKPNIVIILVEGLGRAFTNDGAYLGNFTPFIDSLSTKSLYWKNFLSQGGRTFAVLPSIMGSLPFGKNGYLAMGTQMPEQLSLYNILKYNGYHTSFYYGGDSRFDEMNTFLSKNKVDEIRDERSFPTIFQKLPLQNGFTWGYGDEQLYQYFLKSNTGTQPKLDVILTVASHNPFLINNQEKYLSMFEKRMDELKFDEAKKSTYRNYKLQYSSILYTDDAVKEFIAQYKKRADFNNTIFIITGDHRMPEIPMRTKIDRFHVPLLIYSPMLKKTAEIESISTHFDIAPSLLSYLKNSYGVVTPETTAFMGSGLDTARSFRNIHNYPFIRTKSEIIDYLMGPYFLNQNSVYKLDNNLLEADESDVAIKNQIKNEFEKFKKKNQKVTPGNKLYPDSILSKFIP